MTRGVAKQTLLLCLVCGFQQESRAADRFDSVREFIRADMERKKIPSIAVAVSKDGEVVWEEGFGFADPKLFAPLAEEFHVPLGDDPNEAMNKGQAFEREVLEKLKQAEQ